MKIAIVFLISLFGLYSFADQIQPALPTCYKLIPKVGSGENLKRDLLQRAPRLVCVESIESFSAPFGSDRVRIKFGIGYNENMPLPPVQDFYSKEGIFDVQKKTSLAWVKFYRDEEVGRDCYKDVTYGEYVCYQYSHFLESQYNYSSKDKKFEIQKLTISVQAYKEADPSNANTPLRYSHSNVFSYEKL